MDCSILGFRYPHIFLNIIMWCSSIDNETAPLIHNASTQFHPQFKQVRFELWNPETFLKVYLSFSLLNHLGPAIHNCSEDRQKFHRVFACPRKRTKTVYLPHKGSAISDWHVSLCSLLPFKPHAKYVWIYGHHEEPRILAETNNV